MSKTMLGTLLLLAVLSVVTFASHPWNALAASFGLKNSDPAGLHYSANLAVFMLYALTGMVTAWWVHRVSA